MRLNKKPQWGLMITGGITGIKRFDKGRTAALEGPKG